MPISSLFEIGARVLRRHAPWLVAIAVMIQLPGALLDAVAQQRLASSIAPIVVGLDTDAPRILTPTDAQTSDILGAMALVLGAMLISMVLGAIAAVAYATVVQRDYHAITTSLREVLALALQRGFPAIGAAILAALTVLGVVAITVLIITVAVLLLPGEGTGGPGVFLALVAAVGGVAMALTLVVRLCLATIVVAIEGSGPVAAIRRSWHLTGRNTWRTFAVLAILAFVVSILASLLSQVLGLTISDTIGVRLGIQGTVEAVIAAAISVLFAPVAVVVQTVLYFDLRVRRDAWDLPAPDPGIET